MNVVLAQKCLWKVCSMSTWNIETCQTVGQTMFMSSNLADDQFLKLMANHLPMASNY